MQLVHILLTTLLATFPRVPQPQRGRIDERRESIVAAAAAASAAHGVPPEILLVVGFLETHLGTDSGEGGNWGAPISRSRRHTAGTPDHAASALAAGYRVCGTWFGAVSRFRCGLCRCPKLHGYAAAAVMRRAEQIRARLPR